MKKYTFTNILILLLFIIEKFTLWNPFKHFHISLPALLLKKPKGRLAKNQKIKNIFLNYSDLLTFFYS